MRFWTRIVFARPETDYSVRSSENGFLAIYIYNYTTRRLAAGRPKGVAKTLMTKFDKLFACRVRLWFTVFRSNFLIPHDRRVTLKNVWCRNLPLFLEGVRRFLLVILVIAGKWLCCTDCLWMEMVIEAFAIFKIVWNCSNLMIDVLCNWVGPLMPMLGGGVVVGLVCSKATDDFTVAARMQL